MISTQHLNTPDPEKPIAMARGRCSASFSSSPPPSIDITDSLKAWIGLFIAVNRPQQPLINCWLNRQPSHVEFQSDSMPGGGVPIQDSGSRAWASSIIIIPRHHRPHGGALQHGNISLAGLCSWNSMTPDYQCQRDAESRKKLEGAT